MFVHLLFQKIHFCYDAAPFWSLCFALRSRMLYDRGKMLYSPRKHRLSVYFSILTLYISYRSKLTKSITSYRGRFHFEFQNLQQYSESKVSHIYFCFKNLLNCVLQCFYLFFLQSISRQFHFVCSIRRIDEFKNIIFNSLFLYINALYLYIVCFPSRMIALSKNYNNKCDFCSMIQSKCRLISILFK